ncbi:MAG TPA: nuclear transport factor 2 family protein [Gemmatimonadota bacterium]|nr:nuclear transport factor 2 family protein [Gemmatimonadota bacterium]
MIAGENKECRELLEREAVVEVANRLFIATDDRDWDTALSCFADEVLYDMTSITGGAPERMSALRIVEGWNEGLRALKAIHHQVGNHVVRIQRDEADLFCYGIAIHYLPNGTNRNTRTFVGSYDLHLQRVRDTWRVDRFAFHLKFVDGNVDLESSQSS